tara:strand:+ start:1677 stop:2096 length:420 start_codon:yes stop_codon:yes gene_type:complete
MNLDLILESIESRSWICNYIFEKGIIGKEEFNILSRFGAWVVENHPQFMKAYWSYLNKLMKKFDAEESLENSKKIFRPWATKTINFIKTSQLNRAYNSFCLMVINLTEHYNKDYKLFTQEELQIYMSLKKSVEDTKLYF